MAFMTKLMHARGIQKNKHMTKNPSSQESLNNISHPNPSSQVYLKNIEETIRTQLNPPTRYVLAKHSIEKPNGMHD